MREILYRGLNANGEFVYGLPYLDAPNSTEYYNDYSYRITWIPEKGGHANQPVKNGTIGQFTGMVDTNGVKIFEGDIVKFIDEEDLSNESNGTYYEDVVNTGKVYWSDWSMAWDITPRECDRLDSFFEVEVIGNIYQNPELLEENN